MLLRFWWNRIDDLIGQAVRQELPEGGLRALRIVLSAICLLGVLVAWARPASAPVCLLFPLLVTSFFEGTAIGLTLLPGMVWIMSRGPVETLDTALFLALCLFSVLISGVTSHKYREIFTHRQGLLGRLEIAREVQRGLEPPALLSVGPVVLETSMEVSQELGGDFVAVHGAPDGSALLVMGDVQGKGPQSALTAAYLTGVFQQCCSSGVHQPEQILARLHAALEGRDESRFVTALCLRCHPDATVEIVNAGHPRPVLCSPSGASMVGVGGLVLGLAGMLDLGQAVVRLDSGEKLLLLSDGCYEEEALCASLARLASRPGLQLSSVLEWVNAQTETERDDRTVVLVARRPGESAV